MMRFIRKSAVFVASMALCSTPAEAVVCTGPISYTGIEMNGFVKSYFGFGNSVICNLNNPYTVQAGAYGTQTISIVQCQAILAEFMTAASSGKSVAAFVNGSSCPNTDDMATNYPMAFVFYT